MHLFPLSQGGPVVMVQIENEFGSYGDVSKSAKDRKCTPLLTPHP